MFTSETFRDRANHRIFLGNRPNIRLAPSLAFPTISLWICRQGRRLYGDAGREQANSSGGGERKTPGRYSDGHGLWLQISQSGTKAWLFRYMINGRARHMGLGPLHTVNLAEARVREGKPDN